MSSFNLTVFRCRIRLFPTLISKKSRVWTTLNKLNPFESVVSIPRKWLNQKSRLKFLSGLMDDESHSSNISKSFWDQIKLLKRNGAQQVMVNQINGNYHGGLTRRQWLLKWLICKLESVTFDLFMIFSGPMQKPLHWSQKTSLLSDGKIVMHMLLGQNKLVKKWKTGSWIGMFIYLELWMKMASDKNQIHGSPSFIVPKSK